MKPDDALQAQLSIQQPLREQLLGSGLCSGRTAVIKTGSLLSENCEARREVETCSEVLRPAMKKSGRVRKLGEDIKRELF